MPLASRLGACFLVLVSLAGCGPQATRTTAPVADAYRGQELAALETVLLEPGPAPRPELADVPLRSAGGRAGTFGAPLRMDTRVGQYADLWARLRARMAIPRPYGSRIQHELAWFQRNQRYIDRVTERARRYLPYIVAEAERRGLPMELTLLPVVESGFQPYAYSPARAAGLWQFIPSTARVFDLRIDWWYDGRRDVIESTRAAFDYLQKLNRDFKGDWLLSAAAYNWGEGNVGRAIRNNRKAGKPTDFWSLKLPAETRTYVPRWLAVAEVISRPDHYGVKLAPIPDLPYFETVPLDGQVDLAVAARAAGIGLDELYLLNPGFARSSTSPDGPHRLLVPVGAADGFTARLASIPASERTQLQRHAVASGESLGGIARRYGTTVAAIRKANKLKGNRIRIGQTLQVPTGGTESAGRALSPALRASLAKSVRDAGPAPSIHVVRSGDSLWTIGRKYKVSVSQISRWNGLSRRAVLRPGQKLSIHRPGVDAVKAPVRSEGEPDAGQTTHVVASGESLWLIANRYRTSVAALTRLNRISSAATLQPGQKLKVGTNGKKKTKSSNRDSKAQTTRDDTSNPTGSPSGSPTGSTADETRTRRVQYRVKAGDSLWLIARRFDVRVKWLRRWNSLPANAVLRPGQTIEVRVEGARVEDARVEAADET